MEKIKKKVVKKNDKINNEKEKKGNIANSSSEIADSNINKDANPSLDIDNLDNLEGPDNIEDEEYEEINNEDLNNLEAELSGSPLISLYLKDLSNYNILSREEETELFKKYTKNKDKEAYNKIYLHNLKLVVHIAKKYASGRKSMELMDIIQEGNIGLDAAIKKFDYKKGYKFSTYATWWIKQSIMRGISNYDETIRIPVHLQEKVYKIHSEIKKAEMEYCRELTTEEKRKVIENLYDARVAKEYLQQYETISGIKNVVSLETPAGEEDDGESTLQHFIKVDDEDVSETISKKIASSEIRAELEQILTPKELEVIERRILNPEKETLEQISKDYHVTRERIRQIESRAIRKLRKSWRFKKFKELLK